MNKLLALSAFLAAPAVAQQPAPRVETVASPVARGSAFHR